LSEVWVADQRDSHKQWDNRRRKEKEEINAKEELLNQMKN